MRLSILLATTAIGTSALAIRGSSIDPPTESAPRIVWEGHMAEARAAHQASALPNGPVLITGGCRDGGCRPILASAEVYDPTTRSFEPTAPMNTPRAGHAAVTLEDGRVLIVGGWTGTEATPTAEVYDPSLERFIRLADMHEGRQSPSATALRDGRVLILGGTTAEVFDPATSRFESLGPFQRRAPILVTLDDGRVLVTGGDRIRGEVLRTAVIFDPATNGFEPTGDMTVPRHKHGAALLADGRAIIVGGSNARDFRGRYASSEVYDPRTGTFTAGPNLRSARHKIRDAVVALPSGAVLVAGGAAQPELWDPADQVFIPVDGELSGAQMFASATVLVTGDVLVLGGYDERIRPSPNAWLIGSTR